MEQQKPLTTVHEALALSAMSEDSPGDPTSIRLETDLKREAAAICVRNGSNLSKFLRQCCLQLVSDYVDPSRG